MAEQSRRMRRISVPKETQDILEQHYQANPYPNRFEYLFMSRNANIDINRLKNWFNNRRRADSRVGTLCRRCRCFKAPTNESHLDESGQFRPCHEVWNVLFQTKEANNNQVNSPPPQLQATSLVNGNYAQFMPHQQANPPLSTYVDAAALIRFMNAWQRSRNESLPFYQNQQFLVQQHQNAAPMWANQQQLNHFQTPVNSYLQNAWMNVQPTDLAPVNRNYQQECQFNAPQMPFNQSLPINNSVFSANSQASISIKSDE